MIEEQIQQQNEQIKSKFDSFETYERCLKQIIKA